MTKICHMTSAHEPEDDRIFFKECISCVNGGYDVYLVQSGTSYEKNGVHIIGVGKPKGRLSRMLSFSKRVYKAALDVDADIYHFHDPELLPYGKKLKKKGKKVVFDSHERYTEQLRTKSYLPSFVGTAVSKLYGAYEKKVLSKIDAVIFPCTMDGKDPFEGLCRRSRIISNAAVLGEFFDKYDQTHQRLPESVCYVGGLTDARGITNDIKAAYSAGARLYLAGDFSSEEYEAECRKMKEFECVDYRGRLDRNGVTALLADCRIGLCTLKDRGQYLKLGTFGIKVFEYMSMAMPVILSHSEYNDRMVEKYGFGICVDPEDPKDIAGAIRYLLDHPDEAAEMGLKGRKAIKEEYNWSVEEKKLLGLYEELINE